MSKLNFIKRHYKAFLIFSGLCIVCLSLGFNMVILPWYDKQFGAKVKGLQPLGTDTEYENYKGSYTGSILFYGANWVGQTFTIGTVGTNVNHTVTSIKLYTCKAPAGTPNPGIVNVSIRATSLGLPTGADLCSGTLDGNTFTVTATYNWYEFTMSPSNIVLRKNTKYAIIYRAPSGNVNNYIRWRGTTANPYTAGNMINSANSGSTWSNETGDFMFDEFGLVYNNAPTFSTPQPTNGSTGISLTPKCNITLGDADGDAMTLTWQENSTGSWVTRQVNTSCHTGSTYRWTNAQATANSHVYYWKVWCNDGIVNVSSWYKFTTVAAAAFPDSPSPFTASKRDSSSLALAWTKGAGADYTRIQYKTGGYPTTIADGTNACNNTGSSYLLPGLAAGTKYYFSGWSWNTTNKAWSVNPTNVNQTTKAYASLYTSTLTGGNITTIYRSLFTSLLTGGNITTTYRALFTSTLTGGNATSIYKALFTSTLTGGNISTTKSLFTSLLTGGNISSDKSLFTSLLTGGNVTTIYKSLFTSILTGGNISIGINPLFTSLLTGGNTTAYASLFTSTLTGGNISSDKSLFTSLLTGGNITNRYASLFTSLLTGGNISLGNWTSLFTSNLSGGNISSNHSFFTSLLSGGNVTSPHSLWTSLLTGGNTSVLTPITPFNPNLYLINPNPANSTTSYNTNFLKANASGLTTSIDVFYENFTTPAALMPGDYSMTIIGTTPANTPVIWNTSAVYATVHDTLYGIITPGNPYVGQYYLNPNYDIFRSFLLFNTGLIPNEAIINSAYIQLVVYDDYSDDDFNVTVQETKLPVPHNPLITLDYYKNSFSNYFGHTNTTGYTDEDIFNIALTPLGVAFLEKSDETAFGIRSDQDINSSAPTGDEFVIFYGYGVATAKYPKLIVNFTIPPSNWAYFVNLTWLSNSSGAWTEYYKSYVSSNGTTTVPAINFSGVNSYFWHLEWESNKTNNGSSQIFTFTTVNTSGGTGASMNGENRFAVGLISGFAILLMIGVALLKHMKKKRNGRKT